MSTKPIGGEFEPILGPNGRTVLVKSEKKIKAKLNLCARATREKNKHTRIRYGKKGAI